MGSQFGNLLYGATPLPSTLNPQVVYSWKAPLRAFKKRSKNVLRFYIAVAILLSAIIFFVGDKILIVPIWAVLFLFYVLTITPPPEIENKITKFGIETVGITLRWDVLSHFYFTKRFGFDILIIVTHPPYNMHSYLIIPSNKIKQDVMRILIEHIVFLDKPQLSLVDRMINIISYLIPDDDDNEAIPATISIKKDHKKNSLLEVKDTLSSFFQKHEDPSRQQQIVSPNEKDLHQSLPASRQAPWQE